MPPARLQPAPRLSSRAPPSAADPHEEEILFAPLAALEVSGTPAIEDGHTIVVPLKVNCNLHDLTIEQVPADAFATQRCLFPSLSAVIPSH